MAVLQSSISVSLDRPTPFRHVPPTGPFWATVQCIITLGLWPLLVWPTRWSTFVEGERQKLLLLANAWRRRVAGRQAEQLDSIARRLRPKPMLLVLSWLIVGFNVAVLGLVLMRNNEPEYLWQLTYGHRDIIGTRTIQMPSHRHWTQPIFFHSSVGRLPQDIGIDVPVIREPEANLYQIWLGSLLLGYICHWYAVRSHASAVNQLIGWTNGLARQNHFDEIQTRATRVGLSLFWVIAAIAFCANSAWWAIPMCLVGAMQRRYITRTSPAIVSLLAEQAQVGFSQVNLETSRICPAHRCGAKVPIAAKFCPRCGTAV